MEQNNGGDQPGFHASTEPITSGEVFDFTAETFTDRITRELEPSFKEELILGREVAKQVEVAGGLALVVGGFARDEVLRRFGYDMTSKDIDIEVYGVEFEDLKALLHELGPHKADVVGEAFGVLKYGGLDISIPRRDSKAGVGHKGFTIEGDPHMSVADAARRRDFTINAIALNPLTGQIIDEYGGVEDIRNKVLRATDLQLFADDPLRVLRAMQFAGRFDFVIDPTTIELCRGLDLTELPVERIGEEWNKLLLKSLKPSTGLEAARELGVIAKLHPELAALFDVPQEAEWHPEGDVWIHTKMVMDAAEQITEREGLAGRDKLIVMLGALCHDLGKPATTTFHTEKQRITSHGHEPAGEEPTKSFLASINMSAATIKTVVPLVREHLYPSVNRGASDAAVRRLSARLNPATIYELVLVAEADHHGRDTEWDGFPQGVELLRSAKALHVTDSQPKPYIMGRHLVEMGRQPGPEFGKILKALFEAQLDGAFDSEESGLVFLHAHIGKLQ